MDNLEGYWYYTKEKLDTNFICDNMQIKSKTNAPPYLVVDKSIKSVNITGDWPGELWRVRIQELGDMSNLIANLSYWRANAIMLLECLPLSELFGRHGEKVVGLLTQIQSLTLEQVDTIQSALNPNASEAYLRAWKVWNDMLEFPRDARFDERDYNILAMPHQQDKEMSPINHGFLVIHDLIWERAHELEGDNAFKLVQDVDGDATVLADKWKNTASAFLYAAMALGAPNYIIQKDHGLLIYAWQSAFISQQCTTLILYPD